MFGTTFYHGTIRKYVILFGTLFNNIYVNRPDASRDIIRTLRVPLSYGPKEKTLARTIADPKLDRPVAITLPRMSFELMTMTYAGQRKLPTVNKIPYVVGNDDNLLQYTYNPVPYDFQFQLNVMVRNADDGTRIVEQILPFFTPDWTATINIIPDINMVMDIPIVLNSIDSTDTYEGNFDTRRALIWTLNFTLKGYLFGPVKKQGVIKTAIVNALAANTAFNLDTFELVQPDGSIVADTTFPYEGTDLSSKLTTEPYIVSNTSIDPADISISDEYAIKTTKSSEF